MEAGKIRFAVLQFIRADRQMTRMGAKFSNFPSIKNENNFTKSYYSAGVGRDSSVGIATRYRLDDPGIESRWERGFRTVQSVPGAHPASYTIGAGLLSRGVKRPGRAVEHSPHLAPRLKKE